MFWKVLSNTKQQPIVTTADSWANSALSNNSVRNIIINNHSEGQNPSITVVGFISIS